jgi:hypothetical protein
LIICGVITKGINLTPTPRKGKHQQYILFQFI